MVVTNNQNGCGQSSPKKPMGYKVSAWSGDQLRSIAKDAVLLLREEGCYPCGGDYLDVRFLLENVLQRAGYTYHVAETSEFPETVGFTIPEEKLIVLREDVYNEIDHDPFARFTVVHEFSHIILNHAVSLHRGAILGRHKWYEDSEWQANNLAAEILMPVDVVLRCNTDEAKIQSSCGVSASAARHRVTNLKSKGVIR